MRSALALSPQIQSPHSSSFRGELCAADGRQSTAAVPCEKGKFSTAVLKDRKALAGEIAVALVHDRRDVRSRNKVIARKAESSPRTVEAWLDGRYLPNLDCWFRLAVRSRPLMVMFLRLCEMEASHDPEFQKALAEFIRVVQR